MRILLLTTHLNIGGISRYTISLAKALRQKGNEVYVISSGGMLVTELAPGGVSHINLSIMTKNELSHKVFRAIFEIISISKTLHIDVIHAQTRIAQVVGFFASRLYGCPFITTCHGFFRKNIGRMLLPAWGDRVIAISEAVQAHLIKDFHVDEKKVCLIYNGIDVKKFLRDIPDEQRNRLKDRVGIRRGCPVIGTIGRFTPDKGHDVILYAFYKILKQKPDVQLVFVGEGKERKRIEDLTQRLSLQENVIFLKSQINTVNILSTLDVFMFTPKRKEGLGIALLEALASGRPVVATNVGGISSIVKDGVNGFLVAPSRPEVLVEPILNLLNDRELYKKMSQSAREIVVQKFSINGMADRVEDIYREVTESTR